MLPACSAGIWSSKLACASQPGRSAGGGRAPHDLDAREGGRLAASARITTRDQERSPRLDEPIALAHELHDSVIQQLLAVSLVLEGDEELAGEDRARCLSEVRKAAQDVRAAMERPLTSPQRRPSKLVEVLERLRIDHPDLGLRPQWETGLELPERYEALAQTVLAEAVRNARKHSARRASMSPSPGAEMR